MLRENIVVHLETAAFPAEAVELREIDGTEDFNQPFDFRVVLITRDTAGLDAKAILTKPASLVFTRAGVEERRIFGAISEVRDSLHSEGSRLAYRLRFVPRVWKTSLVKRSQVFVDQSVPDIIKAKLEQAGFKSPDDFEFRLMGTYAKRDLVIQYEETDLRFFSRLTEHLGVAYFFEHRTGRDVLVFSDDNSSFTPVEGNSTIAFVKRGEEAGVFELEGTTRVLPSTYVVKDYNYRTPTVSLLKSAPVQEGDAGEVIEYGAHFKTPEEAQQIAKVRAEELFATRRIFEGRSDVPVLRPGGTFTLDGHPRAESKLLVTRVHHRAIQVVYSAGTGDEHTYKNDFAAIPEASKYRPPRVTPKPKIHGAITGVVEAESPGQYAELDGDGRYHVRFMLDTGDAPRGKASSLLRMAQPHTGPGYGFHFPLRDGVEVILTCIEGDPDRPIITGAVPNPTVPSTVNSKNGRRNVIKTGGGTEINLDDTQDATRFKLTVPFLNTTLQMGAPNEPTRGFFMGTDGDASFRASEQISIQSTSANISLNAFTSMSLQANNSIGLTADVIDIRGHSSITGNTKVL
jgi:type VI secretion system VgrG family protein